MALSSRLAIVADAASTPRAQVVPSRKNVVALDGLRGLAILAVMIHHGVGVLPPTPVGAALYLGWSGVDLFFVLSGFLITGILVDTRECRNYFQSFYCRRVLRIFPLYFTFLLAALVVFPHVVRADRLPLPADRWLYVCYLMNWTALWHEPWHPNVLGHFWSLSVEEQFYFVWPLVVLAMRPRTLLRLAAAGEPAILAGRAWWIWNYGPGQPVAVFTLSRMDGLLFGAACAVIVREYGFTASWTRRLLWAGMLSLGAFVAGYALVGHASRESYVEYVGLVLLAAGYAAILLAAVWSDSKPTRLQKYLRWRPLTVFGKYAYGIYVFHVPIYYFADRILSRMPESLQKSLWFGSLFLLVKGGASFVVASLSYRYFEKPILAYKNRFEPQYGLERQPLPYGRGPEPEISRSEGTA